MAKSKRIEVEGLEITIIDQLSEDYICLTDMAKSKKGDQRAADIIKNWMRNRSTVEFIGTWEVINNPDFKVEKFDHFRKVSGLPTNTLSPTQWVEETGAIGIFSKAGRYGGTYAHKDIAFEFGSAISPSFKLFLIKEFQRLKDLEAKTNNLEWDYRRFLTKVNYRLQTDSIKDKILPDLSIPKDKEWLVYAEEADILNYALFNQTAKDWKEDNPERTLQGRNIRDYADVYELTVMANL